ncbi:unnamed protein product [Leptidea sinapis]|uniref:Uncharacterized protein n=1 Tax=Leptidea sinapis TaxID=189913 RepID=A0A5E4PW93_9NEOP|nr:unnamed protein product [Leptidea sinapis]
MYRLVILTFVSSALAYLDGDIDLTDGIKLVGVPVSNSIEDEGRSLGASPFYKIARFLQGHELHVKLPSLIEKEKLSQVFAESLKAVDETYKEKAATGRGKGDGGTGSLALLGLMFAKTIGAAGIGGLGLLTMKLTSHDDHDDHQVIYAGHGHHRRKRDLHTPLPYQGWTEYRL